DHGKPVKKQSTRCDGGLTKPYPLPSYFNSKGVVTLSPLAPLPRADLDFPFDGDCGEGGWEIVEERRGSQPRLSSRPANHPADAFAWPTMVRAACVWGGLCTAFEPLPIRHRSNGALPTA